MGRTLAPLMGIGLAGPTVGAKEVSIGMAGFVLTRDSSFRLTVLASIGFACCIPCPTTIARIRRFLVLVQNLEALSTIEAL
jgi:hypothetical protein